MRDFERTALSSALLQTGDALFQRGMRSKQLGYTTCDAECGHVLRQSGGLM